MSISTILLDDVAPEDVRWLWPGRIPLGKLSIIDGDPGLGKSLLTLDIAARLTTGRPMPDGSQPEMSGPANVLICSVEDGLGDTIRPRLSLAGADLRRVKAITGVPEGADYDRSVELPKDWPAIFEAAASFDAAWVILDPLMALLSGDVNSHRDQDIRRALMPGVRLAQETDAAVTFVRHPNKAIGASALHRGGGSVGIAGAARSVMLVAKLPDDETDTRRVLANVKGNLAPPQPALVYQVDSVGAHPRLSWHGSVSLTADELSAPPAKARETTPERAQILAVFGADEWLRPSDVAERIGKHPSTITTIMSRMATAGDLVRPAFGRYSLPERQLATVSLHQKSVASVASVASGDDEPSQEAQLTTVATPLTTLTTLTTLSGCSDTVASWPTRHNACRICGLAGAVKPDSLNRGLCSACLAEHARR